MSAPKKRVAQREVTNTQSLVVKLDALTGLRFFAAAMIVWHHSAQIYGLPRPQAQLSQGVSLFFVLSGFILAYRYPSLSGTKDRLHFIASRIGRIWPAHFATLVLSVVLLGTAIDVPLVANGFLLHGWVPLREYYLSGNSVSWSVSTEFFFYLLFPLLIVKFSTTWYWKVLLSGVAVFVMFWLCGYLSLPISSEDHVSSIGLLYIVPVGRAAEFVLGMTAYLLWRRLRALPALPSDFAMFTAAEIFAVFAANYLMAAHGGAASYMQVYLGSVSAAPAFALIIILLALERGAISRLLRTKTMVFLGEISFSLYLVHQLIIRYQMSQGATTASEAYYGGFALFSIVCLVAAATLWAGVEVPCRNFVRNRLSGRRAPARRKANPTGYMAATGAVLLALLWGISAYTFNGRIINLALVTREKTPTVIEGRCALDAVTPMHNAMGWLKKGALVYGWAINERTVSAPSHLRIRLRAVGGEDFVLPGVRFERPDLAAALKSPTYLLGGWRFNALFSEIPVGTYPVFVDQFVNGTWSTCDTERSITIRWLSPSLDVHTI